MNNLIVFGYGAAMILGFAAVWTVIYYGFSRSNKYETYTMKYKEDLYEQNESIDNSDEITSEKMLDNL